MCIELGVMSARAEFERISEGLADALDFSRTIGAEAEGSYETGGGRGVLGEVDFYTRYDAIARVHQEIMALNWIRSLSVMRA